MKPKKPTKAKVQKLQPKTAVVFLLNAERVLAEIAELAKLHISEILKVEPTAVTCSLELAKGGKVIPTFNVDAPDAGAWEKKYIQEGIAEVWLGWAKQELVDRLSGLSEVRRDATEEDRPDTSPEEDQEEAGQDTAPSEG